MHPIVSVRDLPLWIGMWGGKGRERREWRRHRTLILRGLPSASDRLRSSKIRVAAVVAPSEYPKMPYMAVSNFFYVLSSEGEGIRTSISGSASIISSSRWMASCTLVVV